MKQRVRRDVEPPEVRRFLRQELLTKVGHSWWNRPRVYRYDRDDEREPMQSLRSVVVVPQGQEQQELSPAVPGDRMTMVRPVASPVTSLPHTPGRDIVVIGSSEESPSRGNHHAGNGGRGLRHPRPGKAPSLPSRVAREQQGPYGRPAGGAERGRSPGRTSYPAAEVGIDARTAGGRIPERNGAEAGVGPVQPQPRRRAGAATTRVQPRARDRVIRE